MIFKHVPFVRVLAVSAPLLLATSLLAQGEDDPAAEQSFLAEVFDYDKAGPIGYLIMLMSIVAVALIIENFMTIKREKLSPPDILDELEALFDGENFQDAVELCEQEKNYLTN